ARVGPEVVQRHMKVLGRERLALEPEFPAEILRAPLDLRGGLGTRDDRKERAVGPSLRLFEPRLRNSSWHDVIVQFYDARWSGVCNQRKFAPRLVQRLAPAGQPAVL